MHKLGDTARDLQVRNFNFDLSDPNVHPLSTVPHALVLIDGKWGFLVAMEKDTKERHALGCFRKRCGIGGVVSVWATWKSLVKYFEKLNNNERRD